MKFVAFICNVVLLGFTLLVLLSDGISKESAYIVLTILLLSVPLLSLVILTFNVDHKSWFNFCIKRKASDEQRKIVNLYSVSNLSRIITILSNIVLFGFSIWAVVDQYLHPEEDGIIAFTLLVFLIPILNSVTLLSGISLKGVPEI